MCIKCEQMNEKYNQAPFRYRNSFEADLESISVVGNSRFDRLSFPRFKQTLMPLLLAQFDLRPNFHPCVHDLGNHVGNLDQVIVVLCSRTVLAEEMLYIITVLFLLVESSVFNGPPAPAKKDYSFYILL